MAIEPGTQLLHYRLIEKIGEGGMGVVWKATDTNLDREVAIKILPDAFVGDVERLARFKREAELSARLQCVGIVQVHTASLEGREPYLVQAFASGGYGVDRVAKITRMRGIYA